MILHHSLRQRYDSHACSQKWHDYAKGHHSARVVPGARGYNVYFSQFSHHFYCILSQVPAYRRIGIPQVCIPVHTYVSQVQVAVTLARNLVVASRGSRSSSSDVWRPTSKQPSSEAARLPRALRPVMHVPQLLRYREIWFEICVSPCPFAAQGEVQRARSLGQQTLREGNSLKN